VDDPDASTLKAAHALLRQNQAPLRRLKVSGELAGAFDAVAGDDVPQFLPHRITNCTVGCDDVRHYSIFFACHGQ